MSVNENSFSTMITALKNRNFRIFWIGESISMFGDQLFFIALPWLVLQMTGDAVAVGTVFAIIGIPRALFMLLGGAMTDRLSPRLILLLSNLLRLLIFIILTSLVFSGTITLGMIYVGAVCLGFVDAFFVPAQSAIVPSLVKEEQLQGALSLVQTMLQVNTIIGPLLAGILMTALATADLVGGSSNTLGIAVVIGIDALTFLISVISLLLLRVKQPQQINPSQPSPTNLWASIREGCSYVWHTPRLRLIFLMLVIYSFLIQGPFFVGIPVLAAERYTQGVSSLGLIMSAAGGGTLLGKTTVVSDWLQQTDTLVT